MQYLVNFENIKQMQIKMLLHNLGNMDGIRLNELKVKDLTSYNGNEIFPGIGVYIFREGVRAIYVGKCSSNSFTERIPKHFDLRHYAWMNNLLKIICVKRLGEITDENLKKASKDAFDKFNMILITFSNRNKINRVEKLLRIALNPLNNFRHPQPLNLESIVGEY